MNSENDARAALLEIMGADWVVDRVENDTSRTGKTGFADLAYTSRGVSGFTEVKFLREFGKAPIKVGLRRDQAEFLIRHGRAGGQCSVVVGVGLGRRLYAYNWVCCERLLGLCEPLWLLNAGRLLTKNGAKHFFRGVQ